MSWLIRQPTMFSPTRAKALSVCRIQPYPPWAYNAGVRIDITTRYPPLVGECPDGAEV